MLDVLAVMVCGTAGVAWLQFTAAFVVEFFSVRRAAGSGQRVARTRSVPLVFQGQQRLAHTLVTALLLLGPTLVSTGGRRLRLGAAGDGNSRAATASGGAPGSSDRGDDLGGDAQRRPEKLVGSGGALPGAGDRWQQLWALNHGSSQADGTVLSSPTTLLHTGWSITVPAPTGTPSRAAPLEATPLRLVTVAPGDSLAALATAHGNHRHLHTSGQLTS